MAVRWSPATGSGDAVAADGGQARQAALAALLGVLAQGRSLTQTLGEALAPLHDPAERALAQELAFGVMRWYPRFEAWLSALMARPLRARDRDIQAILMLGLYQLAETRVPPHAAVHTAVDLARGTGKRWSAGLVNAVLRRFQAQREDLWASMGSEPEVEYAHPAWMLRRLRHDWPDRWQEICRAANARPPMTLRVNRRRATAAGYLDSLRDEGLDGSLHPWAPDAVTLTQPRRVEALPGFAGGLVSVQDAAGQLAAELLDPQPGMRLLDVCAAPGSKACHLLEREPALAALTAVDIDDRRLDSLRDNLERLGLEADVIAGDGSRPGDWWDGQAYQRILLDAPCSATGVIRRHPDIKCLRREGDLGALVQAQITLLRAVWPLLDRGGMLVYATCSVLLDENAGVVDAFLREQADARPADPVCPWGIRLDPGRQIPTGMAGMDGFYYAVLRKV